MVLHRDGIAIRVLKNNKGHKMNYSDLLQAAKRDRRNATIDGFIAGISGSILCAVLANAAIKWWFA